MAVRNSLEVYIYPTVDSVAEKAADIVTASIKAITGRNFVLGTATGNTYRPVYEELIERRTEHRVSFEDVVCFGLDEYSSLPPDHPQSYFYYMTSRFWDPVGIQPEHRHLPASNWSDRDCNAYEQAILEAGGIDLQLLGIGRTGHFGFNEPPADPNSRTRVVRLADKTRQDAVREFGNLDRVPKTAITMGMATILEARSLLVIATGESKAKIVRKSLLKQRTPEIPASYFDKHPSVTWILDEAAAADLPQDYPALRDV